MKSEKTTAIVLRRTDYGEADRIVQFITPLGRRSGIAKGVRKPKSKLAGGIELLSEADVIFRSGKGSLQIVSSARMKVFYAHILEDYDRLTFAYEALRLIAKASEAVDETEWFTVAHEVLEALDSLQVSLALIKAWFYLQYAKLLGEELSVWRDVAGEKILPATNYLYDGTEKVLRQAQNGTVTENHIKLLRVLSERPLHVVRHVGGTKEYEAVCADVALRHASIFSKSKGAPA